MPQKRSSNVTSCGRASMIHNDETLASANVTQINKIKSSLSVKVWCMGNPTLLLFHYVNVTHADLGMRSYSLLLLLFSNSNTWMIQPAFILSPDRCKPYFALPWAYTSWFLFFLLTLPFYSFDALFSSTDAGTIPATSLLREWKYRSWTWQEKKTKKKTGSH